MQNTTITTFKESEGSTGYARWRKEVLAAVAAAQGSPLLLVSYNDIHPTVATAITIHSPAPQHTAHRLMGAWRRALAHACVRPHRCTHAHPRTHTLAVVQRLRRPLSPQHMFSVGVQHRWATCAMPSLIKGHGSAALRDGFAVCFDCCRWGSIVPRGVACRIEGIHAVIA